VAIVGKRGEERGEERREEWVLPPTP